jgi:ubiquinone biosynthesis protein COQ9
MTLSEIQHQLLAAMLPHVPFDGWSERALQLACHDIKLREIDVIRAFPNGATDALDCYMEHLDMQMLAALQQLPLNDMKLHEKVESAILLRLAAAAPHREAIRKAVAYYALPFHADRGLKRLYKTTDAIWRAIGDHPTDFSFYTKRLSLAAIYSSTLLFWLDDHSDDPTETKAFLQRRLYNLYQFHQFKQRIRNPFAMHKRAG